jgi:hypothetical protein
VRSGWSWRRREDIIFHCWPVASKRTVRQRHQSACYEKVRLVSSPQREDRQAGFRANRKHYCRWGKKKGYRTNEAKAKAIYAMACDGIPTLLSSVASTKMLTLEAVRVLREVNRTLEIILTQMQELATTSPEYGVVRAMKGVGNVLAPRLIAEIGDVRRFHSGSALIAFSGINSPP